jgi:hypothetical protein
MFQLFFMLGVWADCMLLHICLGYGKGGCHQGQPQGAAWGSLGGGASENMLVLLERNVA